MPEKPLYTSTIDMHDHAIHVPAAIVTFTQPLFTKIHGPFKFYVSVTRMPDAGNYEYVVEPGQVYQDWEPNGKSVDAHFPLTAVGGNARFQFHAVSVAPGTEVPIIDGVCPT